MSEAEIGSFILKYARRPADAERILDPAFERSLRVLGPASPTTIRLGVDLATSLSWQSRHDRSVPLARSTLNSIDRVYGYDNQAWFDSRAMLAGVLGLGGAVGEAQELFTRLVPVVRSTYGDGHPLLALIERELSILRDLSDGE